MLEQQNDMLLHACSFVLLNDHHCSNWQGNNYIVCVDSAVGPLYHVDVGNVANILEVPAVSSFKVEVSSCISRFWFNRPTKGEWEEAWCPVQNNMDRELLSKQPFLGPLNAPSHQEQLLLPSNHLPECSLGDAAPIYAT